MTLLEVMQRLEQAELNKGTSGNASMRDADGFIITPSGVTVERLYDDAMVKMTLEGEPEAGKKPSSEWRFHRDIYVAKPEVNAIIHTHSMFATTVACLRRNIPAFHYMIAVAGGSDIRCAPYALFGSQGLSDAALAALSGRKACLLANHGMIAVGRDLEDALAVAIEVENLAEQYWRLLQLGEPVLLTDAEMEAVFEQFKGYANWLQPK